MFQEKTSDWMGEAICTSSIQEIIKSKYTKNAYMQQLKKTILTGIVSESHFSYKIDRWPIYMNMCYLWK